MPVSSRLFLCSYDIHYIGQYRIKSSENRKKPMFVRTKWGIKPQVTTPQKNPTLTHHPPPHTIRTPPSTPSSPPSTPPPPSTPRHDYTRAMPRLPTTPPATWRAWRTAAFHHTRGLCAVCHTRQAIDLDHIVPTSQGGLDTPENLRPICTTCHRKKSRHENAAAATARRRSRPPETHPGLTPD